MVIGRPMASGVRAIFQALIIIPIALVIGVRFQPNPLYIPLSLHDYFYLVWGIRSDIDTRRLLHEDA
jgi:ABC-2 type transport system permease protein